MNFSKYFSDVLKANGLPNLSVRQYQKILNIIILEARIDETNKLLNSNLDGNAKFILNKRNYNLYSKLHNLTKSENPESILKYLIDYE